MKSSELLHQMHRVGWKIATQKGSHMKLVHVGRNDFIIFPDHGSNEMGKGLEMKIKKQVGL